MERRQAERSNRNHDAVQRDKVGLILHDRVPPPVGHLSDTEDAPCEDGQVGEAEAADEQFEAQRVHELDGRGFELRAVGVHAGSVVRDHAAEDEEGEDLPDDTGHHEIVAHVLHRGAVIGCRCDASAGSLQDEGEEIGEAEDPGVELGSDAGEVGAEFEGNVFEGQVNARGDEGGGDDEAADLNFESIRRPRVAVEHYPSDVT